MLYLYPVQSPWAKAGSRTDLHQEQGQEDSADNETGKQGRPGAQTTLTGEHSTIGYQIPTLFLSQFVQWSAQKLPAVMVPLFRVMPLSQNIFWKYVGISMFGYILEGDTDNTTQCLSAQ